MIINTPAKDTDTEEQKIIIEALNKSGIIYRHLCDYRKSYELLIKGLDLCEKYGYDRYVSKFYTNIGDIYYRFKKYDIAKSYALKALATCRDSISSIIILNNLGHLEQESGEADSALVFLNRSLQLSKQHNNLYLDGIQNTIASFYQKTQQYDSAAYYFRLSLEEAKRNNKLEYEAENLSGLGKLFFEVGERDSALRYIGLSSAIAVDNHFLEILAENHLTLSAIGELNRQDKAALKHLKQYANLKDSIFDIDRFGDINQIQRLYEVSKTNQQIEQLTIERQIKERTIYYQQIIWLITLGVLLLVSGVLLVVFFQKRKLNKAYRALVEKNLKIIELQELGSEKQSKKYQKSALTDLMQQELLNKILAVMEDTSIICDTEFSLDKLAHLVHSNHAYVSQVINHVLKKNFRSFLNTYRIREAQRLFASPDAAKYTIEFVAFKVGFKSRNAFSDIFKEITGVNPNFYLKAIQKQPHL